MPHADQARGRILDDTAGVLWCAAVVQPRACGNRGRGRPGDVVHLQGEIRSRESASGAVGGRTNVVLDKSWSSVPGEPGDRLVSHVGAVEDDGIPVRRRQGVVESTVHLDDACERGT